MRIIAGTLRSRLLRAPSGADTRPTSDRLRETLFNVLSPRVEGAAFLDLYAGSGAVGIEALSRGARSAEFVEQSRAAIGVLRDNLAQLGVGSRAYVHAGSAANWLRKDVARSNSRPAEAAGKRPGEIFDLVFLDPPWDAAAEYEIALGLLGGPARRLLSPGALVVAEHRRKQALAEYYGILQRTRLLEQGDAALSFFSPGLDPQIAIPGGNLSAL